MRFVGIDPSTKTGFVALDEQGNVLVEKEIEGKGKQDPERIASLVDNIMREIDADDIICIEGFSYGSKGKGVSFQYGLGYMIRDRLFRKNIEYTDVTPSAVKKFATGKGNAKKDAMAVPIYKRWGFEHNSDNVRDAYVLAQIARAMSPKIAVQVTKEQFDVLQAIKKPASKKRKKVAR